MKSQQTRYDDCALVKLCNSFPRLLSGVKVVVAIVLGGPIGAKVRAIEAPDCSCDVLLINLSRVAAPSTVASLPSLSSSFVSHFDSYFIFSAPK